MNNTLQEFIDIYAYDGILHLASANRKETLAKLLAVPFDPEVHYPLAYIHLHFAMLDEAKAILDHTTNKDDETYKQLEDYLNALLECDRSNVGIFPLTISYRQWWNGPHLSFPEEYKDNKLSEWFPVRLDCIIDEIANLTLAKKEGDEITYLYVEFPSIKVGEIKEETMGEVAFYGDNYLLKFHEEDEWVQPPELRAVYEVVKPIITRSHNLLNEWIQKDLAKRTEGQNVAKNSKT